VILDEIVKHSQLELESKIHSIPMEKMREMAFAIPRPRDLSAALRGPEMKLIAEVKRASPSRGIIVPDFDPVSIARTYATNRVAAISILTETKFFQGSPLYLQAINRALGEDRPPLIRKDFIYDPYQVYEARAFGADAFLLIAAILSPQSLENLEKIGRQLNMASLVEVHNEREVDMALASGAEIIGVNNRDLRNFEVDLNTTLRLARHIPPDKILVSESGIKTRQDVARLRGCGVSAILVGESLLASGDIAAKIKELS
jgi:indole-3-glycerol phosphate synthase